MKYWKVILLVSRDGCYLLTKTRYTHLTEIYPDNTYMFNIGLYEVVVSDLRWVDACYRGDIKERKILGAGFDKRVHITRGQLFSDFEWKWAVKAIRDGNYNNVTIDD